MRKLKENVVLGDISGEAKRRMIAKKHMIEKWSEILNVGKNRSEHIKPDCEDEYPFLRMSAGQCFVSYDMEKENTLRVKATRLSQAYKCRFWVIRHRKLGLLEVVRVL